MSLWNVRLDGVGREWKLLFREATSLDELELEDCFSSGETAAEFFAEVGVPRLRRLSLWSNGLATGVSKIARVLRPAADSLVEFGIGANGLTGRGVCTLVDGVRPERLWLTQNPLGTDGLRQVAKQVDAARINKVAVAGCKLDDTGGEVLARWLEGSKLRHVFASENALGERSAIAFASRWHHTLEGTLLLAENRLGDEGVKRLVSTTTCERLRWLDLSENGLTSNAVQALVDSPHLARLHELELQGNDLGDAGAIAMGPSRLFRRLRELDLCSTGLTRVGVATLAEHARPTLKTFWLRQGNEVPELFARAMMSRGVVVL